MRYGNLHTHTTFSDGANTIEENIRQAEAQEMLCLGISDHSYTPFDQSYCLPRERYGAYRAALEQAKRYADLPLFAGLELDAYSDDDPSEFDFIIASVHYLKAGGSYYSVDHSAETNRICIRDAFGGSALDMMRCYLDVLGNHVARTKPTVIGHFDLPAKFGVMPEEDDGYRAMTAEALKEMLKLCPYIELNTGAIARGSRTVPYPAPWLLDTVREKGGRVVLGSDSHRAENLTFWFDRGVELLKAHGFREIFVWTGAGFESVPLE